MSLSVDKNFYFSSKLLQSCDVQLYHLMNQNHA